MLKSLLVLIQDSVNHGAQNRPEKFRGFRETHARLIPALGTKWHQDDGKATSQFHVNKNNMYCREEGMFEGQGQLNITSSRTKRSGKKIENKGFTHSRRNTDFIELLVLSTYASSPNYSHLSAS